jgi:hypothetical protein
VRLGAKGVDGVQLLQQPGRILARLLPPPQLIQELDPLGIALQDAVQDGLVAPGDLLLDVQDLAVARHALDLPAAQRPQERRLARPVPPDQTVLAAPDQRHVAVGDQLGAAVGHADRLEAQVPDRGAADEPHLPKLQSLLSLLSLACFQGFVRV